MTTRDIGKLVQGLIVAAKGRRRKPSERNLTIHQEVRVEGGDPLEVAALHGVSRRRVSAICQQVDRWYGEQEPWRLGELEGASAERAERLVAKRRLEHVYLWALRGLKTSGQSLTEGHTTMTDGEPTVRKQVQSDHHFNVQWLKLAKGSAEKLIELAKENQTGEVAPPARVARGEAVLRALTCLRRAIRKEAQQADQEGIGKLVQQVVLACVDESSPPALEDMPDPPGLECDLPQASAAEASEAPGMCTNYSRERDGISVNESKVAAIGDGASDAVDATCDARRARKSAGK